MKALSFHSSVQPEIDDAHAWYSQQSTTAADGFLEELDPALDRIQESPKRYAPHLHGTRRLLLDHYPYSVIFRERLHDIQIIAVAHTSRRPGYWARRIKQ